MKKKLMPLYFTIFILVIFIVAILSLNKNDGKPKLTDEEIQFIKENKDTIFLTGYYPSEKRFSEKLCEKIEEDISLKLRIYDDTWNNCLHLLESGSLPIVMNMNRTEKREEYAYFTDTLMPIPCGIYSNFDNGVSSFKDIKGKVIGVEKEVALLEKFIEEYPNLEYELIIYDTFKETRNAFASGEIDCFLSTKSYDNNVKGLHFFEIESITKGTNHIGVSKEYPILYSILEKEVEYLKQQNSDILVSDIIGFELEKSLVEFSQREIDYLNENESFVVGLPDEYFLYAYGDEYNAKGIIPEIVEKIGFICGINCVYRFDSLKNLNLRNDIDFYIDNSIIKDYASNTVFDDEIIVVGTSEKKIINEIYELASYNVGVFGVPNADDYLLQQMPNINAKDFTDFKIASKEIESGEIDYLVAPNLYFSSIIQSKYLEIRGKLEGGANRFVSDDKNFMEIINKCVSVIDIQKIINSEMEQIHKQRKPYVYALSLMILAGVLVVSRKLYVYLRKFYYMDNEYGLYNVKYLHKKLKKNDVYLILLKIDNANDVLYHYKEKIFDKYISEFLKQIKKSLLETENIIYVDTDKFLIVKKYNENVLALCNSLNKDIVLRNIILNYNLNICYIDYLREDTLENTLNKLKIGINFAKEKNEVIYFGEQMQNIYKNKMARDERIKTMINEENVELLFANIIGENRKNFGKYVSTCNDDVANTTLYKSANRLNLATKLDRAVIKTVTSKSYERNENIFINVSEKTLVADGFFDWVDSKLAQNSNVTLYFLMSFEAYDRNIDILKENKNINYAINNFGNDLKSDCLSKYYAIKYLLLDFSLINDLEANEEVLDFIKEFAMKNNKKIISTNKLLEGADYYIEED